MSLKSFNTLALMSTTSEGDQGRERWVSSACHGSKTRLPKKQRHLARRKEGSARKRKQNTILAKHHEHVGNQCRDFHYLHTAYFLNTSAVVIG